jgi:hypothetical protein
MTDPIDIDELRAGLEVTASSTPPPRARWTVPWAWPSFGHERTYGDLAEAMRLARDDVSKEMARAYDPVLRIGDGESDAAALERIEAETKRRWLIDRRMVLLARKWCGELMIEAYRRQLAYNARHNAAYLNGSIKNFPSSDTLRATLRLATGLEDPLPRGDA